MFKKNKVDVWTHKRHISANFFGRLQPFICCIREPKWIAYYVVYTKTADQSLSKVL